MKKWIIGILITTICTWMVVGAIGIYYLMITEETFVPDISSGTQYIIFCNEYDNTCYIENDKTQIKKSLKL